MNQAPRDNFAAIIIDAREKKWLRDSELSTRGGQTGALRHPASTVIINSRLIKSEQRFISRFERILLTFAFQLHSP